MMDRELRVGLVGASASGGWARESHVPAIRGVEGLVLQAVLGQEQSRAEEAAREFHAHSAYSSSEALFADPSIDIVTVAVKVPDHYSLVLGALRAGKHVYCEWPLAPTVRQAEELASAAKHTDRKVAIGLQARANPAVTTAKQLLAKGSIGQVQSIRSISTSSAWGKSADPAMVFAEDPGAGVNLVMIQGAHTVDLMTSLAGDLVEGTALAGRQYPQVQVVGEDRIVTRHTFDHLLVQGLLEGGATLSAEIIGGRPKDDTPFELKIFGESGALSLTGGAPRGFQSGRLALVWNGNPVPLEEAHFLPDAALNVAGIYRLLQQDILRHTSTTPDFADAVRLTRLIDGFLSSSEHHRWFNNER